MSLLQKINFVIFPHPEQWKEQQEYQTNFQIALQNDTGNRDTLVNGLVEMLSKNVECNFQILMKCLQSWELDDLAGTLRNISVASMRLPELFEEPLPLLSKSEGNARIILKEEQVHALIAGGFMCLFPFRHEHILDDIHLPRFNFTRLFHEDDARSLRHGSSSSKMEKLKAILLYFKHFSNTEFDPQREIVFTRKTLDLQSGNASLKDWCCFETPLRNIHVDARRKIEDWGNYLQVDFANKMVGGGVLGNGCVQEEIRFCTSPELLAGMLFTEELGDFDTLLVEGVRQYSSYTGYGDSFRCTGQMLSDTADVVAMDALYFQKWRRNEQYEDSNVLRELRKCLSAFTTDDRNKGQWISSGKWGCGIFNGDPELKILIQLAVASVCGRDVMFNLMRDWDLMETMAKLDTYFRKEGYTVGRLCTDIQNYNRKIINTGGSVIPLPNFILTQRNHGRRSVSTILLGVWRACRRQPVKTIVFICALCLGIYSLHRAYNYAQQPSTSTGFNIIHLGNIQHTES